MDAKTKALKMVTEAGMQESVFCVDNQEILLKSLKELQSQNPGEIDDAVEMIINQLAKKRAAQEMMKMMGRILDSHND